MIPKIIHYCWFGRKPLPELALKCIASWKKFLPDYEIKEWNEDNFDVNQIPYTAQAYLCGKFAFVSDYARFKIMYEYGGIYFDTDVEVIKALDDIIAKGPFFGLEKDFTKSFLTKKIYCAPGLGFACPPNHTLCKSMINMYKSIKFIKKNGQYNLKNIVQFFSELLLKKGLNPHSGIIQFNDVNIYPTEYFCPINYETKEQKTTQNTRTIHHYAASWVKPNENLPLITRIWNFFHLPNTDLRGKIKHFFSSNTIINHRQ